ncbi:MAG: hypothetical protein GX957_15095 [Clostridiaceae bacterium]|nr:hypothetical protein [Clostridiaceae bacterium]
MDNRSKEKSAFKVFFEENRSLAYTLPLLGVLIIIAVVIFITSLSDKAEDVSSHIPGAVSGIDMEGGNQVEILPQLIRNNDEDSTNIEKDPFESPVMLTGIVYSEDRFIAIIEYDGTTYILETNDKIGYSNWQVTNISEEFVTLQNDNDNITLKLSDTSILQNK